MENVPASFFFAPYMTKITILKLIVKCLSSEQLLLVSDCLNKLYKSYGKWFMFWLISDHMTHIDVKKDLWISDGCLLRNSLWPDLIKQGRLWGSGGSQVHFPVGSCMEYELGLATTFIVSLRCGITPHLNSKSFNFWAHFKYEYIFHVTKKDSYQFL